MTYREFFYTLGAARMMEIGLPKSKLAAHLINSHAFGNDGVSFLDALTRRQIMLKQATYDHLRKIRIEQAFKPENEQRINFLPAAYVIQ